MTVDKDQLYRIFHEADKQFEATLIKLESLAIDTKSKRFMNQLTNGVSNDALAIEALLARTRTTASTVEAAPTFTRAELAAIEALGLKLGWTDFDGVGVPGASLGNLQALACALARHTRGRALLNRSANIAAATRAETHPLATGHSVRYLVFASQAAHYSVTKAVQILGHGQIELILVPATSEGVLDPGALEQFINKHCFPGGAVPLALVCTAGTTVLGAFDDIEDISRVATDATRDLDLQSPIWVHVDAAWGGPMLWSSTRKDRLKGIENADSVILDSHKFFGGALPSSVLMVKHPSILREAFSTAGSDYLFHGNTSDQGLKTLQCGRRPDAFSFWYLMKKYGHEGLALKIDRALRLTEQFVEWTDQVSTTQTQIQRVHSPQFLNVCHQFFHREDIPKSVQSRLTKILRQTLWDQDIVQVNIADVPGHGTCLRWVLSHPDLDLEFLQDVFATAARISRSMLDELDRNSLKTDSLQDFNLDR